MTDTLVLPYAERLLVCLCEALQSTIGGVTCQCALRPGVSPPPADICCSCEGGQGQASVQINRIYSVPAGRFPQGGVTGTLDNCTSYEWAAELALTVYRCVSIADDTGFPSFDELMSDTRKIADDAQAMRKAIMCCDWRVPANGDPDSPQPIVPGAWVGQNPQGGCAGGVMTVQVLLGSQCC